jgi:hypothetical protein
MIDNLEGASEELNQEDAILIRMVVEAVHFPEYLSLLNEHLAQAEEAGWSSLVNAINNILDGERNLAKFDHLDDEDRKILIGILRGLDDVSDLPDAAKAVDPQKTGLKIATLVLAVRCGNAQAGQSLSAMTSVMRGMGGDMEHVGIALVHIINGERDADRLCNSAGPTGTMIIRRILEELDKRELG